MQWQVGIDEAGRGPLAGPVAVGAVAVPEGFDVAREFSGVADSKKLSEKKREKLYAMLEARVALGDARFHVGLSEAAAIDRDGIVPAVRAALAEALEEVVRFNLTTADAGLTKPNIRVLLDGGLRAPEAYAQETIIHGDALIPLISLASIAAKVTRDRLMVALAGEYPHYGFEAHKGYGTAAHLAAIREHGPCVIHRRTFLHMG
ncbi:MAG TPA: ribonuclease HII [Candidatus Paceibacterota bacterium]